MNFCKSFLRLILIFSAFFSIELYAQEKVHVVVSGDTIYSIARSLGVERDELMRVNGITDPTRLRVGQRLVIPGGQSWNAGGQVFHQAVRGDTFYGLAQRYGVTVNEILAANSLAQNYVLKLGDMLIIPVNGAITATGSSGQAASVQVVSAQTASGQTESTARNYSEAIDPSVRWPVIAKELSYMTGVNSGVIITGDRFEPVKSLTSGTVISAGPYRGYGRVAIVQASGGYIYVYGGCESLNVKEGDKIGPGMEMGRLGIDPRTEKPQLFFRVYLNNAPVDPAKAPRA